MSIVINVSIDAKESTKAREPSTQLSKIKSSDDTGKIQNFQYFQSYPNINSNYEEDFVTLSDKSIINLPKYLRANSNDLSSKSKLGPKITTSVTHKIQTTKTLSSSVGFK
jgi:hypothetical protein